MSFCDFVPDDPSCVKEVEPVVVVVDDPVVVVDPVEPEPTADEPTKEDEPKEAEPQTTTKMEGEEKEEMEAENPMFMMGNLAFLGVAAGHVAGISLDLFRYGRSSTGVTDEVYYDLFADYGAADDQTNWYQLSHYIEAYGGLALSGILTLTQLLSMFGVAVDINVMAWHYSTMLLMPIIAMAAGALKFWAYEQFYADVADTTADAASSAVRMASIESDYLNMTVMELGASATLAMNWESWMWAQYLAAGPETQALWREEAMMKAMAMKAVEMELMQDMDWDMDMDMDMKMDKDGKKDMDKKDMDKMDEDATAEFAL